MVKLRDKAKAKDKAEDPAFALAQRLIAETLASLPEQGAISHRWIHDFRVCTKKLRALVQFYRPFSSKTALKQLDHKIARLARVFSEERDRQVMKEITNQFVAEHENLNPQVVAVLSARLQAAAKEQEAENGQAPMDLNAVNLSELATELETVMGDWQRLQGKKTIIRLKEGIQFTYTKARKLAYEAESNDLDDAFHECRKWVKYLAYQLKLLVTSKSDDDRTYLAQLESLGERLGRFNDHCVLEQRINAGVVAGGDSNLEATALLMLAWTVALKRQDKAACHELFDRLFLQPEIPVHC